MSQINVNTIKDKSGYGAPDFPKGLTVTGVITATTLNQNVSGVTTFTDTTFTGVSTFTSGLYVTGGNFLVTPLGAGATVGNNTGVVTYYGDGSQLQGIDASSLTSGGAVKVQATNTGAVVTGILTASTTLNVGTDGQYLKNTGTTLNIGTGVTCYGSTGIVSAISFYGDGSNLDGVDSTLLKDSGGTTRVSCGTTVVTCAASLYPEATGTRDLGAGSKRWQNIYTNDLQLSNEGGANSVDGTWGSYTIQEGENDLFLLNRRNGKKYRFVIEEV